MSVVLETYFFHPLKINNRFLFNRCLYHFEIILHVITAMHRVYYCNKTCIATILEIYLGRPSVELYLPFHSCLNYLYVVFLFYIEMIVMEITFMM